MDRGKAEREKKQVDDYIKKHDIQNTISVAVNDVLADRPHDPLLRIGSLLVRADRSRGILNVVARCVALTVLFTI